MVEMKKYKLGDLGKIVTGKTPRTSIEENYGGDIPFITPSDDLSVKDIREVSKKITELGLKEVKNCLLPPRSICVSCIGSDMGKVVMTSVPSVTNQQFNSIIPNESFDADYIYYLMISIGQQMKNKLGKQSTAVPIVSKSQFSDIDVSIICDIKDQKKVSSVLSSIDNRIENLRAQNRVLEQTAKTIYDYTFLQCAGHQTTYNKTLNRNIPADWEVKKLGDCLASISTGLNPRQNFTLGNGFIKYITVKNLTLDGSIDYSGCDFIDENARAKVHKRSNIKVGDILFASISPLGRCYLIQEKPEDWDINESVFSISPADFTTSYYLYSFLRSKEFVAKAEQRATGSIFLGIRVDTLKKMEVLWPDSKTLGKFNALIEPIFKKQLVNTKQIETLITQRNTLLPLLMTGQIEV